MKVQLLALLLLSCHAKPKIEPEPSTAYRFTREDTSQCIVKFPFGPRTMQELKQECGCAEQLCMVEVIQLRDVPSPKR